MLSIQRLKSGTKCFDVTYLRWEEFRGAMLQPEKYKEIESKLYKADCVIGVADYSIAYV